MTTIKEMIMLEIENIVLDMNDEGDEGLGRLQKYVSKQLDFAEQRGMERAAKIIEAKPNVAEEHPDYYWNLSRGFAVKEIRKAAKEER